jgi:competence ComEA-like helix-hairpin-helix protein
VERALAVGPPDVPPLAGTRTATVLLTIFAVVIAVGLSGRPIQTDRTRTPLPALAHLVEPLPRLRIDPNAATEAELMLLPAIGPVLAGNIIESRENDGPFLAAEDLDRVHRIGPKTIDKIRPFIALPPAEPEATTPDR